MRDVSLKQVCLLSYNNFFVRGCGYFSDSCMSKYIEKINLKLVCMGFTLFYGISLLKKSIPHKVAQTILAHTVEGVCVDKYFYKKG